MNEYIADPSTIDQDLSPDEVAALIINPSIVHKDKTKISHAFQRVEAMMKRHQGRLVSLRGEVEKFRLDSERRGSATTLSPADAVKYMSPRELERIVSGISGQLLMDAQEQLTQAEAARRESLRKAHLIRFEIEGLLEDTSLSVEARNKLLSVAHKLDAETQVTEEQSTGGWQQVKTVKPEKGDLEVLFSNPPSE